MTKNPEERRAEIIAAARELFEERGIEKTKVCDIVQRIGVAQGLFYYYFRSKEEVVAAVLETVISEVERQSNALIEDPKRDFYQKLTAYIDLYLDHVKRFAAGDGREMRLLYHNVEQDRRLSDQVEALIVANAKKIVDVGVQEGALSVHYPGEMICMIIYGLRELSMYMYLEREKLFRMVEQALSLPAGVLSAAA